MYVAAIKRDSSRHHSTSESAMDKFCKGSVLAGFQRMIPESRSRITRSSFILLLLFSIALLLFVFIFRHKSCATLDGRRIRIDRMCPENSNLCFNVYMVKMAIGKKKEIVRLLRYDGRGGNGDSGDTAVVIRPSVGRKGSYDVSRCPDFRKWLIDHTTFTTQYMASMVAATFLMESLPLQETNKDKQVLAIGLGGGAFDMGLHQIKPHVNITVVELEPVVIKLAFKWFGVVDSETHHTILQDGIKFVDDSLNQGRKYDIIALDACGQLSDPVVCPAEPFQNLHTLEKIKNILTPTGSVVVNLISLYNSASNDVGWKKVLKMFASTFKTCVLLNMRTMVNVVLSCTPFSFPNVPNLMEYLDNRLDTVMSTLNLDYVLDNALYVTLLSGK
uniref:Spermine synthase domain containing protein n=1 Tax=Haemonchus contortus TaxID=6289 RepID=A0A7I4YST8_HAECO